MREANDAYHATRQMRVGLDAEAFQFIPKFESHMAWADSLVWFHELRDVAEG